MRNQIEFFAYKRAETAAIQNGRHNTTMKKETETDLKRTT